jgi:cardiolipin synthase (CMP-forming)
MIQLLKQLRAAPNLLTLLRLIFLPFAVIAVLGGHYGWALVIFVVAGISDGLDGLLARLLEQKTTLGQYLDPIADKLLLSTMFLVLSATHKIPWGVTVLVFSRDTIIVIICTLLYVTGAMKVFQPSWLGKANTVAQILTVLFVLLHEVRSDPWIAWGRKEGLNATIILTILSGVHYVVRVALDVRQHGAESKPADGKDST